ncbi:hypothetical protein ACOMHN_016750 [Nucella lapillus]
MAPVSLLRQFERFRASDSQELRLMSRSLRDTLRQSLKRQDCQDSIHVRCRTDGGPFNLRRLQAVTRVRKTVIGDLLFTDDCALNADGLAMSSECLTTADYGNS